MQDHILPLRQSIWLAEFTPCLTRDYNSVQCLQGWNRYISICTSWVPDRNETHSTEVTGFCLDISKICKGRNIQDDLSIGVSSGLHSGQVFAGVVGSKIPRYCILWGHGQYCI